MERKAEAFSGLAEDVFATQSWLLENYRVRFVSCYLWESFAPWSSGPRSLVDDFLLMPFQPVEAEVEGEGAKLFDRGEALLVPAGRRHRFGMPSGRESSRHLIAHFLCDSQLCLNPLKLLPSHFLRFPQAEERLRRFEWLAALYERSPRAAASAGSSLLLELLLDLFAGSSARRDGLCQDERIRRALDLAEERCLDGVTAPELARAAGLGEVQFRKLFRRQTGVSPKRHLTELRMRKACELLVSSPGLRVRELSKALGFKGEWHFCSSFKRFSGSSPAAYRRQALESL